MIRRQWFPLKTRIFGPFTYFTIQVNTINSCYFVAASCAALTGSATLEAWVVRLFPLEFALGVMLTLLYYSLDHFNPENVRNNALWAAKGYPHIPIAVHFEHGLQMPLTLLHATTAAAARERLDCRPRRTQVNQPHPLDCGNHWVHALLLEPSLASDGDDAANHDITSALQLRFGAAHHIDVAQVYWVYAGMRN